MAKALAGRLRRARLDQRVGTTTDPTPGAADPYRLPLSRPREQRVDVSGQMETAEKALRAALDLLGEPWEQKA